MNRIKFLLIGFGIVTLSSYFEILLKIHPTDFQNFVHMCGTILLSVGLSLSEPKEK